MFGNGFQRCELTVNCLSLLLAANCLMANYEQITLGVCIVVKGLRSDLSTDV